MGYMRWLRYGHKIGCLWLLLLKPKTGGDMRYKIDRRSRCHFKIWSSLCKVVNTMVLVLWRYQQSIPQERTMMDSLIIANDFEWLSYYLAVRQRCDPVTTHQPVRRMNQLPDISLKTTTWLRCDLSPSWVNGNCCGFNFWVMFCVPSVRLLVPAVWDECSRSMQLMHL